MSRRFIFSFEGRVMNSNELFNKIKKKKKDKGKLKFSLAIKTLKNINSIDNVIDSFKNIDKFDIYIKEKNTRKSIRLNDILGDEKIMSLIVDNIVKELIKERTFYEDIYIRLIERKDVGS